MDRNRTAPLQGWTPSPDGRGTIDIISSSVITLFFCSWSVLCLNLFPPSFGERRKNWRKFLMAGLAFAGPEFLFQLALGQWCAARRSVNQFRRMKCSGRKMEHEWTMRHAFLANMGGFVLQTRLESSGEDWVCFPLDANQLFYLVEHDYISYDEVGIHKKVISDKNKADALVRIIIVCQILWYCIACIARLCQHLEVTLLEVATVGFIFCSAGTYIFWFNKPMDVERAIVLRPSATIEQILRDAGEDARQPYRLTPMDFVAREEWSWTLYWTHWKGLIRKFGVNWDRMVRPMDKIPDDNFPLIEGWPMWILAVFQIGYGAIHLTGWNLSFPTHTEKLLWHIATVTIMVCILSTWAVEVYAWRMPTGLERREKASTDVQNGENSTSLPRWCSMRRIKRVASRLRNTTNPHDPVMDVPLRTLVPVTLAAFTYTFARTFIILEGFVNLRALPPSTYQSVDWMAFLPHF